MRLSLIFFTGAPRFPKSPPGPATGFLGKETKLLCDLLGNPTPEVKWIEASLNTVGLEIV